MQALVLCAFLKINLKMPAISARRSGQAGVVNVHHGFGLVTATFAFLCSCALSFGDAFSLHGYRS
jgi:hypothetical protein